MVTDPPYGVDYVPEWRRPPPACRSHRGWALPGLEQVNLVNDPAKHTLAPHLATCSKALT